MSDAISAKSAKARATIAIRLIKQNATHRRSFSNCFEMGDGDEVVREIVRRAATDLEIERAYPHVAEWRKTHSEQIAHLCEGPGCRFPGCKRASEEQPHEDDLPDESTGVTLQAVLDDAKSAGECGATAVATFVAEVFEDSDQLSVLAADLASLIAWATNVRDKALETLAREPDFCPECDLPDTRFAFDPERNLFCCPVCQAEFPPTSNDGD